MDNNTEMKLLKDRSTIEDFMVIFTCRRIIVHYPQKPNLVRHIKIQHSVYNIGSSSLDYEHGALGIPNSESSEQLFNFFDFDKSINFLEGSQNLILPNNQILQLHLSTAHANHEQSEFDWNEDKDERKQETNICDIEYSEPKSKTNFPEIFVENSPENCERQKTKRDQKIKRSKSILKSRKSNQKMNLSSKAAKSSLLYKLACEQCNKRFKTHVSYLLHKAVHSFERNSRGFVCNACNKTYPSALRLIKHKRATCLYPEFICEVCNKKQISRELLTHHSHNSCSIFQITAHSCPKCKKNFLTRNGFLKHKRKKVCEDASLVLNNGSDIESGIIKFQCELCGKVYANKSSLAKHIRRHKGIKNYECGTCNKCFADNHQLNVHQRMHSGEKPYLCNQCGKSFGHAGHLNRHFKKHVISSTVVYGKSNVDKGSLKNSQIGNPTKDSNEMQLHLLCHQNDVNTLYNNSNLSLLSVTNHKTLDESHVQ